MQTNEFPIFQSILNEVHTKAFGEPLSCLSHSKALALSWFIEEATGQVLSYKTLANYFSAALRHTPADINPSVTTLAILLRYVYGPLPGNHTVVWYQYRSRHLQGRLASLHTQAAAEAG